MRPDSSRAKGEIPGFKPCHFEKLLSEDKTMFRSKADILAEFKSDKIDTSKKLTFSCGAGITACISEVAAKLAGIKETAVFDGSYQEYNKKGIPDFSNPEWETTYKF